MRTSRKVRSSSASNAETKLRSFAPVESRAPHRFNEAMRGLERRYPGRVLVVDCRGAVGSGRWYDELHPNDQGFGDVAARFRKRIARAFDLATG